MISHRKQNPLWDGIGYGTAARGPSLLPSTHCSIQTSHGQNSAAYGQAVSRRVCAGPLVVAECLTFWSAIPGAERHRCRCTELHCITHDYCALLRPVPQRSLTTHAFASPYFGNLEFMRISSGPRCRAGRRKRQRPHRQNSSTRHRSLGKQVRSASSSEESIAAR